MKKFGVFIGRFQPFHNAHLEVVRFALSKVENLAIVLGSASGSRSVKNPWSTEDRMSMIRQCLTEDENRRVEFVAAKDYLYNDNMWITAVQEKINAITGGSDDVALIGHKKDRSSFYLKLFPQWEFIETGDLSNCQLAATKVRDMYFNMDLCGIKFMVPEPVLERMQNTMMASSSERTEKFMQFKEEYEFVQAYKKMWEAAPFPPTFVTTDAIVIKSGHVLVVRRKGNPGKGLIALPGGFLNQSERIIDGCIRELKEETGIKVQKADLVKSVVDQKVFDHPDRSLRGRTITHAFCINLGTGDLPKVKGMDDAETAYWLPLREAAEQEENFYEDHFHMIHYFTNRF